ncbi:hypothetical protein LX15_001776 [Streptoalloteichus tenebrarius]|uniref:Integrase n=1 Tax=Streptoalloteichus tenebrarius (strain ATCC 17920 / DSM 40477 / JCM 4838 / CBS 697.72 / NBRC 16177 / NCIMB 11028 / NRRL B-12390 / A12253. 1 / ISP 5477) TaxID=1933 RepID=A0ABT1HRD6_STRSD|nr:hypothetical protein [Streptoalloteichus tenebrarius]MCP2258089.1 hypothetical protein [Streptoalloteichus tenebrarius]BFF01762.1 hypothetical protein GCM10020241_34370 [Streptoalloteichus tenebrarius]
MTTVLLGTERMTLRLRSGAYIPLPPGEWGLIAKEWGRSLLADNKSENTIRIYMHALRQLGEWASAQTTPQGKSVAAGYAPAEMTASVMRAYMRRCLKDIRG